MMSPDTTNTWPGTPCRLSGNTNFIRSIFGDYDKNISILLKYDFLIVYFTKKLHWCNCYISEGKVTANWIQYMVNFSAQSTIYSIGVLKNKFYFLVMKRLQIFFGKRFSLESFCKTTMEYCSLM